MSREKTPTTSCSEEIADSDAVAATALNADDVRVVVFGQTRHQARKLLFDSLQSSTCSRTSPPSHLSRRPRTVFPKPPLKAKDEHLLGEMVFGSIPVSISSVTTKIHDVNEPPQLVATLLFDGGSFDADRVGLSRSPCTELNDSLEDIVTPHRHAEPQAQTHQVPSPSKPKLVISVSLVVDTRKNPGFSAAARQQFFVLEHTLHTIKAHTLAIIKAWADSGDLDDRKLSPHGNHLDELLLNFKAAHKFESIIRSHQARICSYFAAPRLQPAWPPTVDRAKEPDSALSAVAVSIAELLRILNHGTRSKLFLAKALTAVLTYHCGWVSTVLPVQLCWSDERLSLESLALREVYGITSLLAEMSRIVVVGKSTTLVRHIIRVLSYFIRCRSARVKQLVAEDDKAPRDGAASGGSSRRSSTSGDFSRISLPGDVPPPTGFQRVLLEPTSEYREPTSGNDAVAQNAVTALFGDVCSELLPFLVIQGLTEMPTMKAVADDLCQHYNYSITGYPIECARCIFVDVDNWSVDVVDVQRLLRMAGGNLTYHVEVMKEPAIGVHHALRGFLGGMDLGLPPQVCLELLEGSLHELCVASNIMHLDAAHDTEVSLPPGIDESDIPLLDAIGQYMEQSEPAKWW